MIIDIVISLEKLENLNNAMVANDLSYYYSRYILSLSKSN